MFALFFSQRKADDIWNKLCLCFADHQLANLTMTAFILAYGQELKAMLSHYGLPMQGELGQAIERYMYHRQYLYLLSSQLTETAAFQMLLCTNGLDSVWKELELVKEYKARSLKLSNMLQNCTPAVRSQAVEGLVRFIKHYLPGVVYLDLSLNGLTALPESFGELAQLKELYLTSNQLIELPVSFGNLMVLEILNLSGNQLKVLPKSFVKLTQLRELNLSNNLLTELPDSFGYLSNLYILYLANNLLTALPESFGNLTGLEVLILNSNRLKVLPRSFQKLIKLSSFIVGNNPLVHPGSQRNNDTPC